MYLLPLKRFPFIICLLLLASPLVAQDSTATKEKIKPRKFAKKAYKRINTGNTYDASDLLEKVLSKQPDNAKAAYTLAYNYYLERDYKKAEQWFEKVTTSFPEAYPKAAYWYAIALKMNGKYAEALKQFNIVIKNYKGPDASKYKKWAKVDAQGCELAIKWKEKPLQVAVVHLNDSVNSPYTDVAPLQWNDSTLLFASLPVDSIIKINKADTTAPQHFLQFYSAIGNGESYAQATPFPLFNQSGLHTANGSYSPDKKRFYYTICEQDKRNEIRCEIYVSEWKQGQWQTGERLGEEVNAAGFTNTQPSIGNDDKGQEILYFVSDRPGGKGGLDIWYSQRKKDGSYSMAKNAAKINTDRNEATPFALLKDTLFFSSQGWAGMGGYDIFFVTGPISKWAEPVNVGYPLNSQTDDMYYRKFGTEKGYLVSNRPGIISIRSETCCDDIFAFMPPAPKVIAIQGYVIDKTTNKIINGALVNLGDGSTVESQITDGDNMYFFPLQFDKNYQLEGKKEGYLPGTAAASTQGLTQSDTLRQDIYLGQLEVGKAYRLKNVYYDYDKWYLREESKKTLDTLYDIMMANPNIIVELGSHTDERATIAYNEYLSQRRAESCMQYLLARGIPLEKLRAKGYGETQLLEDCSPYPECPKAGPGDCPCHQLNRRTEFKVIGTLDGPLKYDDVRYEDLKKKQ
ncbi:MAG: OmpA family protein [Chitinophagales bacterium]|nr:OmpA family protein [Chitinophagales bacterium]